jgi:alkaline phosphatase D
MKVGEPQSAWYLLHAQRADLHLTLGDTHYADTTDPDVQWRHHLRYRQQREFAAVARSTPTYAMWDDHDYGPNNSDGTAEGKERSLAGWRQFWPNPALGATGIPGAFFQFSWGQVDFFVVDGRYHRSPDVAPDDGNKRMLGDAQFGWLVDRLKASEAKFKVIASGSTLNFSKGDGWRIYTFSRHRLMDAIRENGITGVVYMSGDVHRSLIDISKESDRVGYPFIDVISSGIANSATHSFATIDFDTTLENPTVRVRIVFGDGTVRDDRSWTLSQLSPEPPKGLK